MSLPASKWMPVNTTMHHPRQLLFEWLRCEDSLQLSGTGTGACMQGRCTVHFRSLVCSCQGWKNLFLEGITTPLPGSHLVSWFVCITRAAWNTIHCDASSRNGWLRGMGEDADNGYPQVDFLTFILLYHYLLRKKFRYLADSGYSYI